MNRRVFLNALSATAIAQSPTYPDLPALRADHQHKGVIPPNKTYRMMEWECHTPPEGNFNIDLDAALQSARDAGAESMMFYSQDHWGHAFYPSDAAVRHPHLDGDFFGREISIARKLGMSIVCYYSLQFNNQAVLGHPDWGWVNESGEQQRMRWYIACLDSPYRRYVLNMIDEIFSRYEIDELFLDIFGIQFHMYHGGGHNPFCFCRHTEQAWDQAHPGDPYRPGFQTRAGWDRRYQWHQQRTMNAMLEEILGAARKHRPNLIVSLNGGPEAFPDDIMQKVSFIYAEPLTSATGISLGSILMRGWGRPDYQAGVFSQQGYLDAYPGALPRVKANALALQNARVFIVGNAPVIGGLDGHGFSKRWFDVAAETWADLRNVDSLLEGVEPVYSAAALYSQPTREEMASQKRPTDFRNSVLGALEAMTYSGRPVECIPEFRLTPGLLRQFDLFVLPEVEVLSSLHAEALRQWVNDGGTLIASGRCGLIGDNREARANFPLADVFGADFVSEDRKYAYDQQGKLKKGVVQTYLESTGHPLAAGLAASTVGLPGAFQNIRLSAGAQAIMRYRLPFMVEDMANNHWFNWGPPPPGAQTAGPAVVIHPYGKGQCIYFGVPIFQELNRDSFWIRRWLPDLMRTLVPDPIAELRFGALPEYVHGTFFWARNRRTVLVQILNAIELATGGQFVDIPSAEIIANPRKLNVAGARIAWPQPRELPVTTAAGGKLRIAVPNPGRYTALHLLLA